MRLALVGAGRIAHSHLGAVDALDATLSVVVEPRKSVAEPIVEKYDARWLESLDGTDLAQLCDAAILCAPPSTHHDLCAQLLGAGVPVLCEKPLDLSVERANKLFAVSRDKGAALMMASKFRFVDDVVAAKAMIAAGNVGKVIGYHNVFSGRVEMADRWNAKREISGGGVLMDNGTHSVDIARYLLGPITAIQAVEGTRAQDIEVEDSVRVSFKAGGVVGHIDLTWSAQMATPWFLEIYGSEGTVLVGWGESKHKLAGNADWTIYGGGYDKNAAFQRQLHNFMRVVEGRDQPRIGQTDAVASVAAIEAAYASMRHDRWQKVG